MAPARRSVAGGDGERPAGVGDVVDEEHRARAAGPAPDGDVRGHDDAVPHGGEAVGAVAAVAAGRAAVGVGERTEQLELAELGDALGQRGDRAAAACATASPRRRPGDRAQPHVLSTATTALTTAGVIGRVVGRARTDELAQPGAPADVRQPGHGPPVGELLAGGDLALDVDAERGHAGRPLRARASRSTPGRSMASRAVADAPLGHRRSGTTGRRTRRSARTARRTGRRGRGAASPCGTNRRPGSGASPAARPRGPGRRAGSARGRTSTAGRWRSSRPDTRRTAPSTSSTLSIISRRPRRSGVRVSSAAVDSGRPADRRGRRASAATRSSSGNASDAK